MKLEGFALALALSVGATGCATITRGTTQDFTVKSTPPGAAVSTSNGFECPATPCTFRMQRKHGFTVDVTMDGYLPAQATVTSDLSSAGGAGMAGNIIAGGIIGIGVDATSGATQDLNPNPLTVTLIPVPAPVVAEEPAAAAVVEAASSADVAAPASEAPASEEATDGTN